MQSLEAYDRPTTKDACILADAIDRVAPERSVSPVAAGSSSCVPLHTAASSSSSLCVRSAGASNTAMAADSAVSNVNTSVLAPYLNSASSTFTGNSIVFNIHHGRAQEARKGAFTLPVNRDAGITELSRKNGVCHSHQAPVRRKV